MSGCSHGPVSTMPGSVSTPPSGQECDQHPDRLATKRVQGETDSFGCEYVDDCDECFAVHLEAKKNFTNPGVCDLCNHDVLVRKKHRDPEEGSSGPIYDACVPCIVESNARVDAEYPILDDSGDDDDFDQNA